MPSRWYYLLCLIPIAICTPLGVVFLGTLKADVAAMQRFVVPGTHTMTLAAGDYYVYGETASVVAGTRHVHDGWQTQCTLADSAGRAVTLDRVSARRSTYSLGDYAGSSFWSFTIPGADTYTWTCRGDGQGVLAVGPGLGSGIVKAVLMFLAGPLSALAPLFMLMARRRRAARALGLLRPERSSSTAQQRARQAPIK